MSEFNFLTAGEQEAIRNDRLKKIEAAIYSLELDLKLTAIVAPAERSIKEHQIQSQMAGCREAMKVLLEDGE